METIVALISGAIFPFIINFGKKHGVTAKHSFVIIAVAMGAGYVLFELLTPMQIKTNVYSFFAQILTTSFLIYEFLLKNIKK